MMMRLHLPYGNYDNDYNSGGVTAVIKIGIPEVIHNRLTIFMKSRTTTTCWMMTFSKR